MIERPICSEIESASSTSMPRQRAVPSAGETGPPEAGLHEPLDEAFAIIDRWRSLSTRHKKDAVPEGHGKFQGG
jgi:hypothetical protein